MRNVAAELNLGGPGRATRVVLGVLLIALALTDLVSGAAAILIYTAGAIELFTGVSGFSPVYAVLGISRRKGQ